MSRAARRAAALAATLLAAGAAAEVRIADIDEGTDLSIALSPDGETLAITLLGGLWRLPADGGAATVLTPLGQGAQQPRFDPAGRRIVYQRRVDGRWDLWLHDVASGRSAAVTRTAYDEQHPDFLPDGETIVFAANDSGEMRLYQQNLADGTRRPISNIPGEQSFPTVSPLGDIAYVNRRGDRWALRAISAGGADLELYQSRHALAAPSWRPGGGVLTFSEIDAAPATRLKMLVLSDQRIVRTLIAGEDVFVSRSAWPSAAEYVYAADGRLWRRGIGAVNRTPIATFAAAAIESAAQTVYGTPPDAPGPHAVAGFGRPTAAPDGRSHVVTALGDLWIYDRRGAERLTDDAFVELDPAYMPGGETIVFASDRGGRMNLWRMRLDGSAAAQLTFGRDGIYGPVPAPDGRHIAYLAASGFGGSDGAELRVLPIEPRGAPRIVTAGLHEPESIRWHGGSDGAPLVSVTSRIARGHPARRRVAFDLNGNSRQLPATEADDAGEPATAPLPAIEWQRPAAAGRYAVQVGRLFDGVDTDYRRHVDVHVEDSRIVAIVARNARPLPERVLDLRDATMLPGLIDTHVHQSSLLGARLGRAWLAWGVTTVREISDAPAEAVARAEAWASGRRPGPQLVVTPTRGAGQMAGDVAADSPIRVVGTPALSDSLVHVLPRERSVGWQAGPPSRLAELIRPRRSRFGDAPITISPLGRSYGDVDMAFVVSGRYIGTGLAALAGAGLPAEDRDAARVLGRLWDADEIDAWRSIDGDRGSLQPVQQTIARLLRRGGRVAIGSDAPLVPYGYGLHRELAILDAAGVPRDQILRLATAQAAIALGLDRDLGTLEAGKLANFVVVDGDPLARIGDSTRIIGVAVSGGWREREWLLDTDSARRAGGTDVR